MVAVAAALAVVSTAAIVTGCGGADDAPAPLVQQAAVDTDLVVADPKAARPDILLVTFDTLRADFVGAYGHDAGSTPNIDSIAARGVLFESAYAVSSTTLPSHVTLFTGLHLDEHGVRKNGEVASDALVTLAEVLAAAGWDTAAFVSSFVVDRRFGTAQGFGHYDDVFEGADHSSGIRNWEGHELDMPYDRRARDTTERATTWLRARESDAPLFMWVHYFDPHRPYDPPKPWRSRFLSAPKSDPVARVRQLYDGDVAYADDELGRLLGAVRAAAAPDPPLVVVTSDHGEGLWDHGFLEHGVGLHEELVHIPLLFEWPGRIDAGRRAGGLTGLIDVMPTMLGLLGLRTRDLELAGIDLSGAVLRDEPVAPDRTLFLQRRTYAAGRRGHVRVAGPKHALRWQQWKLIESPLEVGTKLYDLTKDPGERRNVAGLQPKLTGELLERLSAWQEGQRPRYGGKGAGAPELSSEARSRLEALGYTD